MLTGELGELLVWWASLQSGRPAIFFIESPQVFISIHFTSGAV